MSTSITSSRRSTGRWVRATSTRSEWDMLLIRLLEGNDSLLRAEALRRARPNRHDQAGVRAAHQLLDQATAQRQRREQVERDRRAARSAESGRCAEFARRQRLAALAAEGDGAWARVAAR